MNGFRFFVSEHDHEFVATNHQSALDGLYRPRVGDGIAGLVEDGTVAFDLDVVWFCGRGAGKCSYETNRTNKWDKLRHRQS